MWFVGLFEGEGCISYSDLRRRGTSAAHLTLGSTDRDVVERVQRMFGGVIHTNKGTNKPMHVWRLNKRDEVVALLQRMRPHMSSRRGARIDEVLPNLIAFEDTRFGDDVFCKNGHLRTDSNTRVHKTNGYKVCRDCARESHRRAA